MKKIVLPQATPEQWEEAFRRMEVVFVKNKTRRWVLMCLKDELKRIVTPEE